MIHISLDDQDDAIKGFFLSLPTDPRGSILELGGQAIVRVLPAASVTPTDDESSVPWTEAKNQRRCDLIDREIDDKLTPAEASELERLQAEMLRYRREVSPLPLDDARRLHQELLATARRAASHP